MKAGIPISNSLVFLSILLLAAHQSFSFVTFKCPSTEEGSALPKLPKAYSTDITINVETNGYTAQVKLAVNQKEQKELIEFKTKDRRVKYIFRGAQKSVLFITYKKDEHPTCLVKNTLDVDKFLESEDAGPSKIISKAFQVIEKQSKFGDSKGDLENGIYVREWEGCFSDPKINVSVKFAVEDWRQPYYSSLDSSTSYPVQVDAQIRGVDDIAFTAFYSNFNPNTPDDALFQTPEDVYCDGFRSDKAPPTMVDYFSYNAEITVFESAVGIAPIVSHRKVFYDYKDKISRVDFYDPLAENPDIFSPISAQEKSIIHDFNAGTQYSIDPLTGKCKQDSFESTFSVISSKKTKGIDMLNGNEYFLLDKAKLSYNGQFPVRGMMADVYTSSLQIDPQTKNKSVISWYFSAEENRIVETDSAEKQVLLRMSIRPETGLDKEGVVIVNFYNFAKEQPDPFKYDLRSCFNESFSKLLVLTFPAHKLLIGSEKIIGMAVHRRIRNITGISKQRIYINEVTFSDKYMYAEFDILEAPITFNKASTLEVLSLDDAFRKLKEAVTGGNFAVRIQVEDKIVILQPEPNGLNVFSGDRTPAPSVIGYKEGSVVALTIGMLLLGFILGGITLNLIMSKKFGISLFQKSNSGNAFSNSLNESSM